MNKSLKYLSICSGIEAISVAWKNLNFKPVAFTEIAKFPCESLKHHFPNVPNWGDITKHKEWNYEQKIDLIVGGTPCQSFSVAGKNGGLTDPRGQLMLSFLEIVSKYKPQWVIWENVAGVLSKPHKPAFAEFLSRLEKCGYGWAYRVLNAQYFGVPQRRRRVFVVAHTDNKTELAAKVLFESKTMRLYPQEKLRPQKEITGTLTKSVGSSGYEFDFIASGGHVIEPFKQSAFGGYSKGVGTLTYSGGSFGGGDETLILETQKIRRLTPIECERLQGFPDNFTQIPWRGKPKEACPDSHRYCALGNSMAVPVVRWIGERILKNS